MQEESGRLVMKLCNRVIEEVGGQADHRPNSRLDMAIGQRVFHEANTLGHGGKWWMPRRQNGMRERIFDARYGAGATQR